MYDLIYAHSCQDYPFIQLVPYSINSNLSEGIFYGYLLSMLNLGATAISKTGETCFSNLVWQGNKQ